MKKHHFVGKLLASLVAAFALATIINQPVAADDAGEYRLQISPTFAEIEEMQPGKTYTGTFKVQNTGTKELNYAIEVTPYSVSDENYTTDTTTETNYTQIKDWVTLSQDSGTLAPDKTEEIQYTIKVPANAPAGGQYALITVRMIQDSESSGNASITATKQIGFRLMTDVDGETNRSGRVVEQGINSILFNPPIIATSVVENTGNVHVKASYVLQVFPLFSDEEVYTNEENPYELTILPETNRFSSISWDGAPHLGIFRVKQTVTIADDTQTIEKTVFLCPIWLIFIILLIIFCVVFWIFGHVKNRKDK